MSNPQSFPQAVECPGGFWEVSCDDVRAMTGVRLIDVREPSEMVGAMVMMDGAENVPLGTIPDACRAWDKDEPLVIICRVGGRSARGALWLQQNGFTNVVSMAGGMMGWNGMMG